MSITVSARQVVGDAERVEPANRRDRQVFRWNDFTLVTLS
jgi:hypothetical protein